MQTLETLKSQGQASLSKLLVNAKEQPDDVKLWGVTAGSAVVGAVAVNAAARGVVAILAALTAPPVALAIGAVGGGYLGWHYIQGRQAAEQAGEPIAGETLAGEPIAETIEVVAEVPAPPSQAASQDDLKQINGIGPVYASRLHAAGVQTFSQLADLSAEQIQQIIGSEGSGHMIEAESWIAKARQFTTAEG